MPEQDAERERRRAERAARPRRPRTKPRPLKGPVKPAVFYVSGDVDPAWFPSEPLYWGACYVLNLVHWRTCCYHRDPEHFVRLVSHYIRKVIGRREWSADRHGKRYAQTIRGILLQHGVIEQEDHAIGAEHRARGYRLAPGFRQVRRLVCPDDAINRRIAQLAQDDDKGQLAIHRQLDDWQRRLQVDRQAADAILPAIPRKRSGKLTQDEYHDVLRQPLERLANGDVVFKVDAQGRCHTGVTAIKRELRAALRYDGAPLVEVDVSCCQPLLMYPLAYRYLSAGRNVRQRLREASFPKDGKPYKAGMQRMGSPYQREIQPIADARPRTLCPPSAQSGPSRGQQGPGAGKGVPPRPPITGATVPQGIEAQGDGEQGTRYAPPADLERFGQLCLANALYQELQQPGEKLAQVKRLFLAALFERNRSMNPRLRAMQQRIARLFPTVARVAREIKGRQHDRLARLLQNHEATVMIYAVCGRLLREHPGLPLFTIHDGILTTPEHAATVEAIIMNEWYRLLGVKPTVKRKGG
jgi:hypothetical protein